MDSYLFIEIIVTVSIAAVFLIIAYMLISKWYSSMRITKKQFIKTLIISLILSAIPITFYLLFNLTNPQHVNLMNPLSYAGELIISIGMVSLPTFKFFFLNYYGKKNLGDTYKLKSRLWYK